jgi:drug/metabolite transporter (DMT)-like permease
MGNEPLKGVLCLTAGIAIFSLQDLIIKHLSGEYPLHQAMVIRSLMALPLLLLLVAYDGGIGKLASHRPWILTVRGCLNVLAYTCYYLGLAALPIANSVALYFTAPLFITVLSVLVLKEDVGPRRWGAVIIGFIGVLVIVRPGTEFFDWAMLLPLFAGLAYSVSQVIARKIGDTEGAATMSFYSNGAFLLTAGALAGLFGSGAFAGAHHESLAFLLRGWVWPDPLDLGLMMACGIVAAAGLTLLAQAYRVAAAHTVAPFEYTALVWGTLYGWLVWRDFPLPTTWLGIAIVVGAGLYVLYRERLRAR